MSLSTSTQFRWPRYALRWSIRAFGTVVICGFIFGAMTSVLISGQAIVMAVGSLVTMVAVGCVFFWTVAEMIADGLQ